MADVLVGHRAQTGNFENEPKKIRRSHLASHVFLKINALHISAVGHPEMLHLGPFL